MELASSVLLGCAILKAKVFEWNEMFAGQRPISRSLVKLLGKQQYLWLGHTR